MQRPKWLYGWGKGKNIFEGSLIIDIPAIKVVEASFNEKLIFFGIGTAQRLEAAVSEEGSREESETKSRAEMKWRIFFDSTLLPPFISVGNVRNLMAGIVALSSGSDSVYSKSTVYVASGSRPSKGNMPVLLDYELAKKIEEAKNKM